MGGIEAATALAGSIADRLAAPDDVRELRLARGWWPQSLAHGAAGVALLHIERARAGVGSWRRVHEWLMCAADGQVVCGEGSHLHYGAPALAFAMNAAADQPGRYERALERLDRHVMALTFSRLRDAQARMDRGELPVLAEFDAIRGLSGLGAYLLRRDPHGDLLGGVLSYLVRLTEPLDAVNGPLPGWWTALDPSGRSSARFPGGHANNGMAHGIAGPLALLSLALRNGISLDGQADAIARIVAWLDEWRQQDDAGVWWPYWVSRTELQGRRLADRGPGRPSWCYGTAGIARAQQLAALALGDPARQRMAESALIRAVTDGPQLVAITDLSLCHGYAGLLHIVGRAARDAATSELAACLPRLLSVMVADNDDPAGLATSLLRPPAGECGLLEGAAGIGLALHTATVGASPISGWDSCLLIA